MARTKRTEPLAPYENELIAMKKIGTLLSKLDLTGRERVVAFIISQFGTTTPTTNGGTTTTHHTTTTTPIRA